MVMYGSVGKLLRVNLTEGNLKDEELNEGFVKKFLGGRGLGVKESAFRLALSNIRHVCLCDIRSSFCSFQVVFSWRTERFDDYRRFVSSCVKFVALVWRDSKGGSSFDLDRFPSRKEDSFSFYEITDLLMGMTVRWSWDAWLNGGYHHHEVIA